jgi:hypothetical protein
MLIINKATYSGIDVTEKVKSFIKNGKLSLKLNENLFKVTINLQ